LRKFVRKNIAGHGHVVTLSDRYIKDSFLRNSLSISPVRMLGSALSIPLFPLVRLPVARVTLRRPKNMRKLQALLNNRYNLNFHSLFDTIRKIRSTDDLWQQVILFLMSNTDVILVDLSVIKEGTRW